MVSGHTSHEVCGLKLLICFGLSHIFVVTPRTRCVGWNAEIGDSIYGFMWSHLARGVWIETLSPSIHNSSSRCHTSHEMCGLETVYILFGVFFFNSYTPRGVLGLNYKTLSIWKQAILCKHNLNNQHDAFFRFNCLFIVKWDVTKN